MKTIIYLGHSVFRISKVVFFLFFAFIYNAYSQVEGIESCEEILKKAKILLESNSPFIEESTLFNLVEPCALAGNPEAENYLGMLYLEGIGVEQDDKEAYLYIKKSAEQGFSKAQFNLGKLYQEGIGCTLNYDKALSWFSKATENGHQRAAYTIGYMYYKGLGLSQSYENAVYWFKQSTDPMAKHWLGVCSYFGYGITQNTDQAIAYLIASDTPNSKVFMEHIKNNKRVKEEEKVEQAISSDNEIPTTNTQEVNQEDLGEKPAELTSKDMVGEWTGKWIEYDESGTDVKRILPINILFTMEDSIYLKAKINFNKQIVENYVLFEDNNMFVDNFIFTLPKQYTHSAKELDLEYQVLGMDFSKKIINNTTYLLADIDAYLEVWKEIAPPMSLILRPVMDAPISEEEQALMIALAEQETEFIKLYPVPFEEQLYIAFDLEQAETVQIKLTGINNGSEMIIEQGKYLSEGQQSYTVNTEHLGEGLYVIKVIINNMVYTRIIIK